MRTNGGGKKESESRRRKQKEDGESAIRQKMNNINVRMVKRLKRQKKGCNREKERINSSQNLGTKASVQG